MEREVNGRKAFWVVFRYRTFDWIPRLILADEHLSNRLVEPIPAKKSHP